ncbi:hypothetical protein [Pseudomonas sp. RIT-PI-S]|nr:hypothetical protein [Pseudomonas sp. RIT-PI-S]
MGPVGYAWLQASLRRSTFPVRHVEHVTQALLKEQALEKQVSDNHLPAV